MTIDGKPSAHAEHTIAITEDGPEVLTLVSSTAPLDRSRLAAKIAG